METLGYGRFSERGFEDKGLVQRNFQNKPTFPCNTSCINICSLITSEQLHLKSHTVKADLITLQFSNPAGVPLRSCYMHIVICRIQRELHPNVFHYRPVTDGEEHQSPNAAYVSL